LAVDDGKEGQPCALAHQHSAGSLGQSRRATKVLQAKRTAGFIHVRLLDNRSEFLGPVQVRVTKERDDFVIEVMGAIAIANTIASVSEFIDPVNIFLGLTRQNLMSQSLRFLIWGEGETGLLVYTILLKYWESTPEDDVASAYFPHERMSRGIMLRSAKPNRRDSAMKNHVFALLVAVASVTVAFPQSSLFDKYDVNMTKWAQLPAGTAWGGLTTWVAADGKGTVIVLVRKAPYFRVFTTDGKFVKSWGDEGLFNEAHSVHFDRNGFIWATDPNDHVVHKFSPEGKLLMTLGKKGITGDNASHDAFDRPNAVTVAPNGDIFVSDGYVNSRVVQFSKDGKFMKIIGGIKGNGPGQLQLPHGVAIDSKGRLLVADSDNKRIAVFDKDGKFIENWAAPCRGNIVIMSDDTLYASDVNAGAVAILKDGKILDVIHVEGRPHGMDVDPATFDVYTSSSVAQSPNVSKSSRKKAASN
jgi:sugar lactone lactonase YvrE